MNEKCSGSVLVLIVTLVIGKHRFVQSGVMCSIVFEQCAYDIVIKVLKLRLTGEQHEQLHHTKIAVMQHGVRLMRCDVRSDYCLIQSFGCITEVHGVIADADGVYTIIASELFDIILYAGIGFNGLKYLNMIAGIDMVIGGFILGAVLSADYTRYQKTRADVFKSSFVGILPIGVILLWAGAALYHR